MNNIEATFKLSNFKTSLRINLVALRLCLATAIRVRLVFWEHAQTLLELQLALLLLLLQLLLLNPL